MNETFTNKTIDHLQADARSSGEAEAAHAEHVQVAVRYATTALAEEGIVSPSTSMLRARLLLDHIREARDIGHGWPKMLRLNASDLAALDACERGVVQAYREALAHERSVMAVKQLERSPTHPGYRAII
jgi:hypothetical protein